MKIHLAHIVPDPRAHGLFGYNEVIESFRWGLTQLGHDVSYKLNFVSAVAHNIIFGFQMIEPELFDKFPPGTIIYNLEQIAGIPKEELRPAYHAVAQKFQIWDFSPANLDTWRLLNPRKPPIIVPIGWAPTLQRIQKRATEDIDVLFYGAPGKERFAVFHKLCYAGARCLFACGFYGQGRNELIARSRIVLNINLYTFARIFEIVRVSYLLGNAKAVVSDLHPQSHIEPDLRGTVAFSPLDTMHETCLSLLKNNQERRELESRGQAIMQKRDIREYLHAALAVAN